MRTIPRYVCRMNSITGCLTVLIALAGPAVIAGETVMVTVRGFVESNQIGDPPLGDAQADDEGTLTLFLPRDRSAWVPPPAPRASAVSSTRT